MGGRGKKQGNVVKKEKNVEEEVIGEETKKKAGVLEEEAASGETELEEKTVGVEVETENDEEDDESMPFPRARVVRVMRQHLDPDKMIKAEVKEALNLFLGEVVADVSKRMNKYPYTMVDYRIFEEAIEPYKTMEKVREEKKRIIAHLDAIKLDCDKLIRDVEETFKDNG